MFAERPEPTLMKHLFHGKNSLDYSAVTLVNEEKKFLALTLGVNVIKYCK
jgi:hypothetical protein